MAYRVLLLSLIVAPCVSLFKDLPLEVASVTPKSDYLSDDQAITVVFSRPIIALGADYQPFDQSNIENAPFTLLNAEDDSRTNLPFKIRFVTTFIARLDLDTSWPTDLRLKLVIKADLTTWDGSKFDQAHIPDPIMFKTNPLSMSVQQVKSELASEKTDDMWTSGYSPREVPVDGVVTLKFSHDVDLNLLRDSIRLDYPSNPSWSSSASHYSLSSDDECASCVIISMDPNNELQTGETYSFTVPVGSKYHASAGPLSATSPLSAVFIYMKPFKFDFQLKNVRYRRLCVFLFHGLHPSTSIDNLKASMSLDRSDQGRDSNPVQFELVLDHKAILCLKADFQPEVSYKLTFEDAQEVKDGFSLPLIGSSATFKMASLTSSITSVAPSNRLALFGASSNGLLQYSTLFTDGSTGSKDYTEHVLPVTEDNLVNTIYSALLPYYTEKELDLNASHTLRGGQSFKETVSLSTGLYLRFKMRGNNRRRSDVSFLSITDLAIAVVSVERNKMAVWVTQGDGGNVELAQVRMYCYESKTFALTSQGTTDASGRLDLTFQTSETSNHPCAVVVKSEGKFAILPSVRLANKPARLPTVAEIITDRAVYRPSEKVFVKGYTRALSRNQIDWEVPESKFTLKIIWKNLDWQLGTDPIIDEIELDIDPVFGTFNAELTVPHNSSFGDKSLQLIASNNANVAMSSFVVGNPRRPTASLSISSDQQYYSVSPVSAPSFEVKVQAETGSGLPMKGVEVAIKWSVERKFSEDIGIYQTRWWISPPPRPQPVTGVLQATTDHDGLVVVPISLLQDVAQNGERLTVSCSSIGPTGEILQAELATVPIAPSALSLSLDLALPVESVLPGFDVDVGISLESLTGTPPQARQVKLVLSTDKEGTNVESESTVSSNAQGTIKLPQMGKYWVFATTTDDRGTTVHSEPIALGKSEKEWEQKPLAEWNTLNPRLDQASYRVGEFLTLGFWQPFEGANRVMVHWSSELGNSFSSLTGLNGAIGLQQITEEVPQLCSKGCNLMILYRVPQNQALSLPVAVPVSKLFSAPRTMFESLKVVVKNDKYRALQGSVSSGQNQYQPGETVDLTVRVPNAEGAAEVAVFAVDRAYLQLKPHPLVDLSSTFTSTSTQGGVRVQDSLNSFGSVEGYTTVAAEAERRWNQDPWILPAWPLRANSYSTDDVDRTDEEYFSRFATCATKFPRGCTPPLSSGSPEIPSGPEMEDGIPFTDRTKGTDEIAAEGPGATVNAPPRTNFNPAPLFKARVSVDEDTKVGSLSFKLPDDIGTFTLRAYFVDSAHHFGRAEFELVSRLPVALEPRLPRFARVGDTFTAGVTVTTDNVEYAGSLFVKASTVDTENGAGVDIQTGTATVNADGIGPFRADFAMKAASLSPQEAKGFSLSFDVSEDGTVVDQLVFPLAVKGVQESVTVATSMALLSEDEGEWTWKEGLAMPSVVKGSGSLHLDAGVGRFAAVDAMASLITEPRSWTSAELHVSRYSLNAALTLYASQSTVDLMQVTQSAARELKALTLPGMGLVRRLNTRYPSKVPDAYLNAIALDLIGYVPVSVKQSLQSLEEKWIDALVMEINRQAEIAVNNGGKFSNYHLLSLVYLAVGPSHSKFEQVHEDVSLTTLLTNSQKLNFGGKLNILMAYLRRDLNLPEGIQAFVTEIQSALRVQGRTAYLAQSAGAKWAAGMREQAMALMVLLETARGGALVEKLANWVAKGNQNSAGSFFAYRESAMALAAISLAKYDEDRGNTDPSLDVNVYCGATSLLSATFDGSDTEVQSSTTPFDDLPTKATWAREQLPAPPKSLVFEGSGKGEASVAVGMVFEPAEVFADPVYRGIFLERSIRVLGTNGEAQGRSVQYAESGQTLKICLQVTSPDDLASVVVEDLVPAGLEPIDESLALDPTLSAATSSSSQFHGAGSGGIRGGAAPQPALIDETPMSRYGWGGWWDPFRGSQEVMVDKVRWQASYLGAGARTVCYHAIANIAGVYTLPPARAFSAQQPEVMGLSGGGKFVVSEAGASIKDTRPIKVRLQEMGVAEMSMYVPKECADGCAPSESCNMRTGECEAPLSLVAVVGGSTATTTDKGDVTNGTGVTTSTKGTAGVTKGTDVDVVTSVITKGTTEGDATKEGTPGSKVSAAFSPGIRTCMLSVIVSVVGVLLNVC